MFDVRKTGEEAEISIIPGEGGGAEIIFGLIWFNLV